MRTFGELAFTPAVQALQSQFGSRESYARMQARQDTPNGLGPRETAFLAQADSFFLATVSETGWPYVQHRGGPAGFLKVISPAQVAYADFRGNRQFVSAGNAMRNDRVSLIVMDYPNQQRLKLMGHLKFLPIEAAGAAMASVVALPNYRARPEHIALIDVEAFDWNCPQHITPRFTAEDIERAAQPLRDRITQLETDITRLRGGIDI